MQNIMRNCYLFGAGVNAYGVMKFFGNIFKGVIDNNPGKLGTSFGGLTIISFQDFLSRWEGETVVVAAYSKSESIVKQLNENGIKDVYVAPLMQNGYWENYEEIIDEFRLCSEKHISLIGNNPLSRGLTEALYDKGYKGLLSIIENKVPVEPGNSGKIILTERIPSGTASCLRGYIDLTAQRLRQQTELAKLKDIHKGKRCFIIGNGPSLKTVDLEKLYQSGDICFGSNLIYKSFADTSWRPYYYVLADYIGWKTVNEEAPSALLQSKHAFIADFYYNEYAIPGNVIQFNMLPFKDKRGFSEDAAEYVYSGGTVTYSAMQIAVYLGFKEIYLLGVDCGNNHFYKDGKEEACDKDAWDPRNFNVSYWLAAYRIAKDYADSHGIKIYNATRGGALEVFERVDFDSLF